MTSKKWNDGSASIILLPTGQVGTELINLVEQWTKSWLLKPAFWISELDVVETSEGLPRIYATVIGRNGSQRVDLFSQLSRLDINNVRVIAARVVGQNQKTDRTQDHSVSIIEKYIEQSRPIKTRTTANHDGITILKVNLVFAPTEQKGASLNELLESHWDVNLVVAPEDRATPMSFDGFTRYDDQEKMIGFILSNIATTASLWSGQRKSIFELSNLFSDLSPIQNQVRVMRTFVRGILSEGLSVRVAVEALKLAGNAETSKLDGSRPIPNKYLVTYEENEKNDEITKMLANALALQDSALLYKKISMQGEITQIETGVIDAMKFFLRSSWSLIRILPLWFFAALWNFIARLVTVRLFGARGREVVKGTIDFPKTDLDKDAARNLIEISERRKKIELALEQWPKNILRKSNPGLWEDLRRLVIGKLDGSALPKDLKHEDKDSAGVIKVFGDLNQILPSLDEEWILPENISRTLETEPRRANWRNMDTLEDIEEFLKARISSLEEEKNVSNLKLDEYKTELETLENSLKQETIKLQEIQKHSKIKNVESTVHV